MLKQPPALTFIDLDSQLASRRTTQASLKSADSIKRFTYLLGQTDLFKHFCDLKVRLLFQQCEGSYAELTRK